jgi:hypothetical protein
VEIEASVARSQNPHLTSDDVFDLARLWPTVFESPDALGLIDHAAKGLKRRTSALAIARKRARKVAAECTALVGQQ